MRTARATLSIIALPLLLSACPKKDGAPSGAGSASASAAPVEKAATKPAMNKELVEHVKAHAEGCTVSVEQGQAYSCKEGVSDALRKYMNEKKPADFASTMAALVRSKDDPKVSAAAVALFAEQFDYLGEEGKAKNATPEVIEATLAAYAENTDNRAVRLAKPAAHLATIGKALDKLVAAVQAHPTKKAKDEAYRHMLTFGRLEAFPTIKEAATKKEHADAALDAVRNMPKATDAEKAQICPWAQGFLSNEDAEVAASAGYDMVYCRAEHIDALLGEAEARLKAKQYKNPFAAVMREPCFQFMAGVTRAAADEAQCDRVYAFLEKAGNDPGVDDATRGLAIWNIYYQRRDEKTLKLMRKYEKHPNKEISKRAKEAIKSLTETYKLKG